MNIAITGMSGYLGRIIATRLADEGSVRLFGMDVKASTSLPDNCILKILDIRSPELKQFFVGHSIDTVIHLAFAIHPVRNLKKAYDIDVNGTRNLLECAAQADVKKVIIASSTTVYGAYPDNPEWLTEGSPLRGAPGYYYSDDKITVEKFCEDFTRAHPAMTVTILRMCYIYGPHVDTAYSRQMSAKKVHLFEGFDPPMQFLHEDDLAEAFYLAATKSHAGVFNVTPDDVVPFSEAVKSAGNTVEWVRLNPGVLAFINLLYKLRIMDIPVVAWNYWKYRWTASNEKFKTTFGFSPRYSSRAAFLSRYRG